MRLYKAAAADPGGVGQVHPGLHGAAPGRPGGAAAGPRRGASTAGLRAPLAACQRRTAARE